MGYFLLIILLAFLLLILWLPTLIALFKKKSTFKAAALILICEVVLAIGLIMVLDIVGASNPAGYILVSAILVSTGGFLYVFIKRDKTKKM